MVGGNKVGVNETGELAVMNGLEVSVVVLWSVISVPWLGNMGLQLMSKT